MTTKTWKPTHPTAVSFTLNLGVNDIDSGVKGLLAVQKYSLTEAPNTLALRLDENLPTTLHSPFLHPSSFLMILIF